MLRDLRAFGVLPQRGHPSRTPKGTTIVATYVHIIVNFVALICQRCISHGPSTYVASHGAWKTVIMLNPRVVLQWRVALDLHPSLGCNVPDDVGDARPTKHCLSFCKAAAAEFASLRIGATSLVSRASGR